MKFAAAEPENLVDIVSRSEERPRLRREEENEVLFVPNDLNRMIGFRLGWSCILITIKNELFWKL